MSNIIIDDVEYTKEQLDMSIKDFYDPIVYEGNQYIYDGMTVSEFLAEQQHQKDNWDSVIEGTYVPLWKQTEDLY